jgi:hypothetical protein
MAKRLADQVVNRGIVSETILAYRFEIDLYRTQLTQAIYSNRKFNRERQFAKYVSQ